MFKVLFWARRKEGQSPEEFRRYWLDVHAPLARDNLKGLRHYEVNIVSGVPEGKPIVDGVAELYFDSPEAFQQALSTPEGKQVLDDLPKFMGQYGPMFADEHKII